MLVTIVLLFKSNIWLELGIYKNIHDNLKYFIYGIILSIILWIIINIKIITKLKINKNILISDITFHLFLSYIEEFLFRSFGIYAMNTIPIILRIFILALLFELIHISIDIKYKRVNYNHLYIKILFERLIFHIIQCFLFLKFNSFTLIIAIHFLFNILNDIVFNAIED